MSYLLVASLIFLYDKLLIATCAFNIIDNMTSSGKEIVTSCEDILVPVNSCFKKHEETIGFYTKH